MTLQCSVTFWLWGIAQRKNGRNSQTATEKVTENAVQAGLTCS